MFHKRLHFLNLNLFILIGGLLLYNIVLVLPYIDMNPARVYMRSQTWTPLPPPSPQHPSGSYPCTSPKHAVSCIRHRLAIRFLQDSIHVTMPFSQIIPPLPLSPKVRYTHLYLFCCLAYRVIIAINTINCFSPKALKLNCLLLANLWP